MSTLTSSSPAAPEKRRHVEEAIPNIREALLTLGFGTVAITVHDDRIVQIDVTKKTRLKPGG